MAGEPTDDDVALTREERERIDGMFIKLANASYYEILGVRPDADRRAIRDAFFAMSRRFHPDAFFGQNLGRWKPRVEHIFRELSRAYDVLANARQRAEYDAFLSARELTTQVSADMLPPVPWSGETPSNLPPPPLPRDPRAGPAHTVSAPPPPSGSTVPPSDRPSSPVTLSPPRVPVISEPPPSPRASATGAARGPVPTPSGAIARPAVAAPPPVSRAVPPGAEPPSRPSLTVPLNRPGGGSIQIDAEAAQRAAREALARKLRGGRPSSGHLPAQRPSGEASPPRTFTPPPRAPGASSATARPSTHAPPAPSAPPRAMIHPTPPPRAPSSPAAPPARPTHGPPAGPPPHADEQPSHGGAPSGGYSALQGLQATRAAQADAQRQARVRALLSAVDEAIGLGDLIAASDALAAARTLAPDDAVIRARSNDVAQQLAASLANKFIEQARFEERSGNWYEAAQSWQKAWLGRNDDFMLLVRAAHALLRADKELPKAADLARRAVMLAPDNLDAHIVLARIFIAGRLRESALATLEAALKIDPTSQIVRDLQKRARGG